MDEIFANHKYAKVLVPRIYNELLKLSKKETNKNT